MRRLGTRGFGVYGGEPHAIAKTGQQPKLIESDPAESEFADLLKAGKCIAPNSAILGKCGKCAGCVEEQEANLLELTGMTLANVCEAVQALRLAKVEPVGGCYMVKTRKGGVLTVRADL